MLARFSCLLAPALALAAVGCGTSTDSAPPPASSLHVGGQTGGEAGIRCTTTVAVAPLAFDANSPLGFSGADLQASLPRAVARPLAWTDGSSAVLDLSLTFTGSAGYAADCRSNAVDVTLGVTSSDGAFADAVPSRLFASMLDRASLDAELDVSSLSGALAMAHPTLVTPADRVLVQVDFAAASASGRVLVLHTDEDSEIGAF